MTNTQEFHTLYNIYVVETYTAWDTSVLTLPSDAAMEWGKQDSEYYGKKATNIWRHCPHPNLSPSLSLGKRPDGVYVEIGREDWRELSESHQKAIRNSERSLGKAFSMFHQYRPEFLLSEVGVPQLGRGSTPHEATYGSSFVSMEKTWEDGMKDPLLS